jgi:hypothetical protein
LPSVLAMVWAESREVAQAQRPRPDMPSACSQPSRVSLCTLQAPATGTCGRCGRRSPYLNGINWHAPLFIS